MKAYSALLIRALLCLLCLTGGTRVSGAAGYAVSMSAPAVPALDAEKKDDGCGQGKATKNFGWKVVAFGVATLKYLIGLLIIPIGLFLVCIGVILEAVEAVAC